LRRLSVESGEELATARLGNQARALATLGSSLIAATDSKLFRLDPQSLDLEARWKTQVPRFTDTIIAVGEILALANWRAPAIALVNLEPWSVRRRKIGRFPVLIRDRDCLLAASRVEGVVHRVRAMRSEIQDDSFDATTFLSADVSEDGVLWLLTGDPPRELIREHVAWMEDASPSRTLVAYDVDAGTVKRETELDDAAQSIALGPESVWVEVPGPVQNRPKLGPLPVRVDIYERNSFARVQTIDAGEGRAIAAVFPSQRIAFAVEVEVDGNGTSELACLEASD
jgi:hypothetical protein